MYMPSFITILVLFTNIMQTKQDRGIKRVKRTVADIHSCPSKVYCQGNLLDTVQRFTIYQDSKTFVDMVQRNPEATTLKNFESMMSSTKNQPTKDDVVKFVEENFIESNESDVWLPEDFNKSPKFLYKIRDPSLRNFAKVLVGYWHLLGRRTNDHVRQNPTQHSLIPVPNGFIVPGGRFREIYYWDSYWIIEGLLLSEMTQTVKGMLDNFVYLIKTYGLIPNGSRIYYINRSQPPLFTSMVGIYIEYTDDLEWLRTSVDYVEKELLWWIDHRTVTITKDGIQYQMAHYGPDSNTPRPESYAEDIATCDYFKADDEKKKCYNSLKTGAETGWDFSTRWIFDAEGSTNANLTNIDSKRVIPVDLNALLCKSFKLLSDFYGKLGNTEKEKKWADYAEKWLKNIKTLLYNEADGIWYDLDRTLLKQRNLFFPSNFVPLWADCYDLDNKDEYGKKAAKYLKDKSIDKYLGGIPTSLEMSREQWDLPNAWPPLQDFVILGLHKTGNEDAKKIAEILANRWITANFKGFCMTGSMFEKYDAVESGIYGGGGEYAVQIGFGWSNGVALAFMNKFSSSPILKASLNSFTYIVVFSLLTLTRKFVCF